MTIIAYIDGLSEPSNPGTGTYGYTIYVGKKKVAEGEGLAGYEVTNNYAEYTALVEVLMKLRRLKPEGDILIRSDSQLLVGQMSKGWKARGGRYLGKLKEAKDLLQEFSTIKFEWVPREQNKEADLLSRIAYEKHRRK